MGFVKQVQSFLKIMQSFHYLLEEKYGCDIQSNTWYLEVHYLKHCSVKEWF